MTWYKVQRKIEIKSSKYVFRIVSKSFAGFSLKGKWLYFFLRGGGEPIKLKILKIYIYHEENYVQYKTAVFSLDKNKCFFSYLNQDVRTTEGYWVGMARWVDFSTLDFRVCVCRIHAPKYSENFQKKYSNIFFKWRAKNFINNKSNKNCTSNTGIYIYKTGIIYPFQKILLKTLNQ